jgi:hypothetical protein
VCLQVETSREIKEKSSAHAVIFGSAVSTFHELGPRFRGGSNSAAGKK